MKKYRIHLRQAAFANNSRYYNPKSSTDKMRKKSAYAKLCPICGKTLDNPLFSMCKECYEFIAAKKNEKENKS